MIVVDTNIIVPLFINGPNTARCSALLARDAVWRTEPYALIELINVFATYHRSKLISTEAVLRHLHEAEQLLTPNLHFIPRQTALECALEYKISSYDAHFLAVAAALGKKLVTEDVKLRAAAPRLTQSLAEAVAAA